jgi:hypothetical protein
LADAHKEQAQREEAVTEHLRTMSAAAEGKCFALSLISTPIALLYSLIHFFPFFSFVLLCCAGFIGVSSSSLQPGDDPLLTAVNLLEANWISIQETFELVSRVLSRLFVGLWPKKKAEVPKDNLVKLAKAFDTTEDPTLQLKGLSLKRGAEGAIALSFAHGADFDWEKVSSPHGRTRDEMKAFSRRQRSWLLHWWQLFLPRQPPQHLLRHLQRRKTQRLRRLLARNLSCLLLPRSKMLRWRRLGFFVAFNFSFCM